MLLFYHDALTMRCRKPDRVEEQTLLSPEIVKHKYDRSLRARLNRIHNVGNFRFNLFSDLNRDLIHGSKLTERLKLGNGT
ncbi:MAG: hypothetical protein HONBIEJF_02548 [Fimbriimonadaceae bacterium]|nr:hypothetical protein [Fimbriimonadaceae bacterium]